MRFTRRTTALGAVVLTVTALAACGSSDPDTDAAASETTGATTEPGVYGESIDPSRPDPTDVATDTPATPSAAPDGTLFVTFSDWNEETDAVEVGSYLPGVVESDGTCTLTLTKGTETATASGEANPDASATSCGLLAVPGSQLGTGTWKAVVTYASGASRASSEAVEVDVP